MGAVLKRSGPAALWLGWRIQLRLDPNASSGGLSCVDATPKPDEADCEENGDCTQDVTERYEAKVPQSRAIVHHRDGGRRTEQIAGGTLKLRLTISRKLFSDQSSEEAEGSAV